MSESFKPGDRVLIVRGAKGAAKIPTRVTEVTSGLFPFHGTKFPELPLGTPVHMLAVVADDGCGVCAPPSWLEPVFDDGSEPIAWTEELKRYCGLSETVDS